MFKTILLNSFLPRKCRKKPCSFCSLQFLQKPFCLDVSLSLIWLPQSRGLISAVSAAVQTLAVIGWAGEVAHFHSTANGDATEPVAHEDKSLNLVLIRLFFSPSVAICFQTAAAITQISQACVNPPHRTTLRSPRLVTDAHLGRLYVKFCILSVSSFFFFGLFRNNMSCTVRWDPHFSCVRSAPKTIKM